MADTLGSRQVRQVYLITYSQADLDFFPDRQSFADAVIEGVNSATNSAMLHWVCAQEMHEDGGSHYHMALKLDKCQRWLPIRDYLESEYGINVNFSNRHSNYYTAWKYVCKDDDTPLQSVPHPDLHDPPKTQAASQTVTQSSQSGEELVVVPSRKRKRERLTNYEVSRLIRDKKLKTRTEVLAFAAMQEREGKTDLAEFIFNRSKKVLEELIQTSLDFDTAEADLERSRLARVAILEGVAEGECVGGCGRSWYGQAEDILARNHIPKSSFSGAIYDLLQQGRGKYRNILLTGPANCGKTFLFSPLTSIFRAFTNPASTTFAWVGVEQAEIILLNDFRWSTQIISWSDFLILLEGDTVHLPAPKTHFSRDICLSADTPIFCTSSNQIVYIKGGEVDQRETEMMMIRWRIFTLNAQIPRREQRDLTPCPRCFAQFVLDR